MHTKTKSKESEDDGRITLNGILKQNVCVDWIHLD
jgi:hypothetical protein